MAFLYNWLSQWKSREPLKVEDHWGYYKGGSKNTCEYKSRLGDVKVILIGKNPVGRLLQKFWEKKLPE